MPPVLCVIFPCTQSLLPSVQIFVRYLIEYESKTFERISVVPWLDLLKGSATTARFTRDYSQLQGTVDNLTAVQFEQIIEISLKSRLKVKEKLESVILSDMGPNCYVKVLLIASYAEPLQYLTTLSCDDIYQMIEVKKIIIYPKDYLQKDPDYETRLRNENWDIVAISTQTPGNLEATMKSFLPSSKPSSMTFGKLTSQVVLMPALKPELNGANILIEGFVEASACFGPAVLSKHVIATDSNSNGDTAGSLCALLHASLLVYKQEESLSLVCVVTLSNANNSSSKSCGIVSTHLDAAKKKSNLVLKLFATDDIPIWLGTLNKLLPEGVFEEQEIILSKGAFPLNDVSKSTCSYNESGCIAWLQSQNLFTEAQKFVRLAKKATPEKRSQVFAEADRIIAIAKALSFFTYMETIGALVAKEIEVCQNPTATAILGELLNKFRLAAMITAAK